MKMTQLTIVLIVATATVSDALAQSIDAWLGRNCVECASLMPGNTGVYILEKGEEALVGRAWLANNAAHSIDVQYFIWSTDNIGTLAAESLLRAAERGVRVRVLVDDLLIDAADKTLLVLAAHPNVHIRIYNPNLTVGVGFWERVGNAFGDFRSINQRMHDKTAIFDNVAGVTGGRNMADEYFDFDHEYNFRDRDVLLLGEAVDDMTENFEEFWNSEFAHPVEEILGTEREGITVAEVEQYATALHAYAADPANFEPQVREAIAAVDQYFPALLGAMSWEDNALFISDSPGKNTGEEGLGGGGASTQMLVDAVRNAQFSVLIQSPYLIMPEGGVELFDELTGRGVRIRVSTNSLASTDNIPAFSGYYGQRDDLLEAGVELYEFKPHPAYQDLLIERYPRLAEKNPIFALHAKSMVIDNETVFIGTFNLDPRSANLNTEVGLLVDSKDLARQLTASIERDIEPGNSWETTEKFNPDAEVSRAKRFKMWMTWLLPVEPVL